MSIGASRTARRIGASRIRPARRLISGPSPDWRPQASVKHAHWHASMGRASLVVAAWLLVCVGVADACTSFDASSCSTGTRKKTTSVTCAANPCTESECCEKLCSSYTCPTGTVQITNAAAVPCNSASGDCNATSCCDAVCGGYTCTWDHTMTGAADKRCPKHAYAVYNAIMSAMHILAIIWGMPPKFRQPAK